MSFNPGVALGYDSVTGSIGNVVLVKPVFGAEGAAQTIDSNHPLPVTNLQLVSSGSAYSSVSGSAVSVVLLPASTSRKGMIIRNQSGVNMYLAWNMSASVDSAMVIEPAQVFVDVPLSNDQSINAVWDSATGMARIVEFT